MTDVQQIEASIRKSDEPTLGAVTCHCVNELIFRVSETDYQGLRALVEATALDELSANRADGPAALRTRFFR